MNRSLIAIVVAFDFASSTRVVPTSSKVSFPFALSGQAVSPRMTRYEFNVACENFLALTRVTDPQFFMEHCVGGTGEQCAGWMMDLVRQTKLENNPHLSKARKKSWCASVYIDVSAEKAAVREEQSAPNQEKSLPEPKPKSGTITNSTVGSAADSKFLAQKEASVNAHSISYMEEVRGKHCGFAAYGKYISTTDDDATCRSKCSADKQCLAYTTYSSKCALTCLHYSRTCNKNHQAVTQCEGDIMSYSKVVENVPPMQSLPEVQPSQTMLKRGSVVHVTTPSKTKDTNATISEGKPSHIMHQRVGAAHEKEPSITKNAEVTKSKGEPAHDMHQNASATHVTSPSKAKKAEVPKTEVKRSPTMQKNVSVDHVTSPSKARNTKAAKAN